MEKLTLAEMTAAISRLNCNQLALFLLNTKEVWCRKIDPCTAGYSGDMHQLVHEFGTVITPVQRKEVLIGVKTHTLINSKPAGDPV